jgi:transposase-like protein
MPYTPAYAVVDGHQGLRRAILERWPKILIQRCHAHVLREMRGFLTLNPKLKASIDLRILVEDLRCIKTRRQKRRWVHRLYRWRRKYESFLKEKTNTPDGHWRFTHRRLRRARSHIVNALPDLFRYIRDHRVPKTSNQLEGGVNSPIKDLVRKHRGFATYKKLVLAAQYLKKRGRKTSTKL